MPNNNEPEVLDLDKINPPKRVVKLAGKEIDLSEIPSRIVFDAFQNQEKIMQGGPEAEEKMYDIIEEVIKHQNEDITLDWIVDNTNITQLMQFMQFVMKPLVKQLNQGNGTGNMMAPNPGQSE